MYQISSYYFARTSSDLPIDCTLPTIFVCILYFMGGLQYTAGAFFSTWFAVLLLVLVAQSFGLLIGAIVPIPKTAQVSLGSPLYLPLAVTRMPLAERPCLHSF